MPDSEAQRPGLHQNLLSTESMRLRDEHTDTSIQNENSHIGLDSFSNLHHLLEKFRFLLMSSRGIYDNQIEPLLLEFSYALCCDRDWICLGIGTKVGHFCLSGGLTCLIESASSECVCANDGRFEPSLLIVYSKLGACCSFTVSLAKRRNERESCIAE